MIQDKTKTEIQELQKMRQAIWERVDMDHFQRFSLLLQVHHAMVNLQDLSVLTASDYALKETR